MSLSYASLGSELGFQQANLPVEMQAALFSVFTTAAALLSIYLLLIRFPSAMEGLMQGLRNFVAKVTGTKHEARLNKVVCYHCNKGMGLYNPIYSSIHGEPHIEGTCSECGGFVRVRLN